MGIRSLKSKKNAKSLKSKGHKELHSFKKEKRSFLKTFLALLLAVFCLGALTVIRYGKQQLFPNPKIHQEDFISGNYEMSPQGSFIIPFNQRMNEESVRNALSILPEKNGVWMWDGNVLKIKPEKAFKTGDEYLITVKNTAKNIFGQPLLNSYELSYQVGFDPQIRAVYPKSDLIGSTDHINILFSHAMLSQEALQSNVGQDFLQITPPIDGEWKWYNEKTLAFHPQEKWDTSTRYSLKNSEAIVSLADAKIDENIERVFQTERFTLIEEELIIEKNTPAHDRESPYILSFNQKPDQSSLKDNILVRSSDGLKIEVNFSSEREKEVAILPVSGFWEYDESYNIEILQSLKPLKGNLTLLEDKEINFKTVSFFILNKDDEGKTYYNPQEKKIRFTTRESISKEKIQKQISIPSLPEWEISKDKNSFVISFEKFSQKRENIKMYYVDEDKKKNIEIIFHISPELSYSTTELEQVFCVISPTLLDGSSSLSETSKRGRSIARIAEDKEGKCPQEEDRFSYYYEKKFFAPNTKHNVQMRLKDIYGNSIIEDIEIITQSIETDERKLQRKSSLFYKNVQNTKDMSLDYQAKNIEKVLVTLCKLESTLALEIENTYEQRWFSFDPTPEKCLKFERREIELQMKWGEEKTERMAIVDLIDEDKIDTGIYYIHLLAPGYYSNQGDPLETHIAIQYSDWNMLSKRGTSSLSWLYDQKKKEPVSGALLRFVSNDGLVLHSETTDVEGLVVLPNTKLKYDFILAKKGTEELLLSTFSQEGIETSRFDVPLDIRDERYQHQFYIEDPSQNDESFQGVFILKHLENGSLQSPNISQGVVVLYDQDERVLWRSYEKFDRLGTLFFSIPSKLMILGGNYQLEVCIGLHQGLCQGESYWTFFDTSSSKLSQENKQLKRSKENLTRERILQLGNYEDLNVGDEVPILLNKLNPKSPLIISAERSGVYWHEILTPDSSSLKTSFTITKEMIPEVIISVVQFSEEKLITDMVSIPVSREEKKLRLISSPIENTKPKIKNAVNKEITDFSYARFSLFGSGSFLQDKALEAFYPRLGTSVISAANIPYSQIEDDEQSLKSIPLHQIQDAVIVNGTLLRPDHQGALLGQQYLIAHDDNGNFANSIFGDLEYDESLELITRFPGFIRPSDKLIYTADIVNKSDATRNLQLVNSAASMSFPNGSNVHVGVLAQQMKTINIATEVSPGIISKRSELSMSIAEQGKILSSRSIILPVIQQESPFSQKTIIQSQSNALQTIVPVPMPHMGEWSVSTVIAASPVAFVVENLRKILEEKTLNLEGMVVKMGLAKDFESLIQVDLNTSSPLLLENELAYLKDLQLSSGAWAELGQTKDIDPLLSASIAKSLALMINSGQDVPEEILVKLKKYLKEILDEKSNERVRTKKTVGEMTHKQGFDELSILHGLSSLTASGVSYANSWYNYREGLSTESLALLVMVFEDYRDAGVSGVVFKIEELIQMLKQRSFESSGKIWLKSSSDGDQKVNDFVLSAWYLEALVRQASSRSDIPAVINWLIEEKNLQKNKSLYRQSSYLQAMGAYLKIYKEQINTSEISLNAINSDISYDLHEEKKGQIFFLEELVKKDDERKEQSITISTQQAQPLFIEVSLVSKDQQKRPVENGLAVFHDLANKQLKVEEEIFGEIIIVSDAERSNVVVIQPQISGALPLPVDDDMNKNWITLSSSLHEKWYLIPELSEGETRIPFRWKATHQGVYQVPRVQAYQSATPEINGSSQRESIEIR